jgi:hypothetical protein
MRKKIRLESLKGRYHSDDLGVDGRIILTRILGKWGLGCGLDLCGSGLGPVADCCERGNEPLVSIKYLEFPDKLNVAVQEGACSFRLSNSCTTYVNVTNGTKLKCTRVP